MSMIHRVGRALVWVIVIAAMVSPTVAQPIRISRDQLAEYCKRLRFEEEQLEIARELHDAYVIEFSEMNKVKLDTLREHRAKVKEEGRTRKTTVREFELIEQFIDKKAQISHRLLDDLHLLQLPSDSADDDWESVLRCHRRHGIVWEGGWNEGVLDLVMMISDFEKQDEQRLPGEIRSYERDLDGPLRYADQLQSQLMGDFARLIDKDGNFRPHSETPTYLKLLRREHDVEAKIVDIQRMYVPRFEKCLVRSARPLFRRAVYAKAYASHLSETDVEKALRVALDSDDRSPETNEAIAALARELRQRQTPYLEAIASALCVNTATSLKGTYQPLTEKELKERDELMDQFTPALEDWKQLQSEIAAKLATVLDQQ